MSPSFTGIKLCYTELREKAVVSKKSRHRCNRVFISVWNTFQENEKFLSFDCIIYVKNRSLYFEQIPLRLFYDRFYRPRVNKIFPEFF